MHAQPIEAVMLGVVQRLVGAAQGVIPLTVRANSSPPILRVMSLQHQDYRRQKKTRSTRRGLNSNVQRTDWRRQFQLYPSLCCTAIP
jgi:hypothetical protein